MAHIYTQNNFKNVVACRLKILCMNCKTLEGTLLTILLTFLTFSYSVFLQVLENYECLNQYQHEFWDSRQWVSLITPAATSSHSQFLLVLQSLCTCAKIFL